MKGGILFVFCKPDHPPSGLHKFYLFANRMTSGWASFGLQICRPDGGRWRDEYI